MMLKIKNYSKVIFQNHVIPRSIIITTNNQINDLLTFGFVHQCYKSFTGINIMRLMPIYLTKLIMYGFV